MAVRDLGFAEEFVEFDGVDGCSAHEFDATPVSASQVERGEERDDSVAVVADRSYLPDLSAQLSGHGWRWRGRSARYHGAAGLPGGAGCGCDLDLTVLSLADEGLRV